MNINTRDFKKVLRFEFTLIFLFLAAFVIYLADLLPTQFEEEILSVVGIIGIIPVARSAFHSLWEKKINVDLLATIALFFSFVTAEWTSMLFINLMLSGARVLDLYARRRVRLSLEGLLELKPYKARIVRGAQSVVVPLEEVRVGNLVMVNLGEQVPVDGTIEKGSATINQSSLTGESIPVLREVGDKVLSATVVVSGNILIKAERVGEQTTFEKMINLVEASHNAKTRMKTLGERFASWYIGIMLVVSAVLYLITKDTKLVLAVVLVVCADDIAIAVPLAYIAAMGTLARRGIIIKSADYLERAAKITTLIVDKTGTITLGNFAVKRVRTFNNIPIAQTLALSGIVCHESTHPVAKAIIKYVQGQNIVCKEPDSFEEKEGRGIKGVSGHDKIIIGRLEFLNRNGVWLGEENFTALQEEESEGNNVTLVGQNGKVVGMFSLADEIRPSARKTISLLKQTGITETVMLTGDNEVVARNIAKEAGIDEYYAGIFPEKKVKLLGNYLGKGRVVAMVGDGVNDAAVLARADIGIAMGGIGSDAAIESADIVLMQDDLGKIVDLRNVAQKVLSVARGNFAIWGVVNAFGLYLVFTGVLDPARAAAYNFLTDFIPIANALRLFNFRGEKV